MPATSTNPAIEAFVAAFPCPLAIGEIEVSEHNGGYQLRHREDTQAADNTLTTLDLVQLRQWVAMDAIERFRPLLSAPTLRPGWRHEALTLQALWDALNTVYPGSIGDWYAIHLDPSRATSGREFVARQSGMYRGAATLSASELDQVTTACCADRHCLKVRRWSSEGTSKDDSLAPALSCLEACPLWLELARRFAKTRQEETVTLDLPLSEARSLLDLIRDYPTDSDPFERIADFSNAKNPRRIGLLAERIKAQFPRQNDGEGE